MIFEGLLGKIIGNKIKDKLGLTGGAVDTKKWWQSQTVWAGVIGILDTAYESLATQVGPSLGWHLPAIPGIVVTILNTLLGAAVIHGRVTAETKIG